MADFEVASSRIQFVKKKGKHEAPETCYGFSILKLSGIGSKELTR